jgi:hypothetical protein
MTEKSDPAGAQVRRYLASLPAKPRKALRAVREAAGLAKR